ncbi:hypothetical protein [Alkalihalobacillus sp. CinArs1]|uniref:hypothetical protein n=1 Tax=Alkalihalobacillus sp. CinArs1 TaxID=2995314 RepID=UPI0022DD3F6B|nr:hypothetical protein [Alkalihalobacillus sp. CinArs1]
MKQLLTLLVVLVLVACTNEETTGTEEKVLAKSDSTLTIKSASLTEREQRIIDQIGIDYKTFFTVDGELADNEHLVSSIVVFQNGDGGKEQFQTYGDDQTFKKALHSFQLHMEDGTAYYTMGSPTGYSKGSTEMPEDLQGYGFEQLEGEVTLKSGETVYLAYVKGSSQNHMDIGGLDDYKTLPDSVKDAEYAIVAQLYITDEP